MKKKRANKLISEKSPYLLQHAYNPVQWYPWCEAAFNKAKKENKIIFLSIGYSTCHWCHVMERESFEDEDIAAMLNKFFVSIKVDREERPDIDHQYMTICQLMSGTAGWPLSIFMTPDKKPFFAATYVPKEKKFNRMGMTELLPQITQAWENKKRNIIHTGNQVELALSHIAVDTEPQDMTESMLSKTYDQLVSNFDEKHGGFSNAPKFMSPHNILFLLRYGKINQEPTALAMVERTLHAIRFGGIYDQVGSGLHRYATDHAWQVPHFEKMIYDQALAILIYIETYQMTKKSEYKDVAKEILSYVLRDMLNQQGGFYSAEDADSEGIEGRYYVWEYQEIKKALKKNADFFIDLYNIKKQGNYLDEASQQETGFNIPYLTLPGSTEKSAYSLSEKKLYQKINRIRKKLLAIRELRQKPLVDDKILTDWNGLMIMALAKTAAILHKKEYLTQAKRTARFILESMRTDDGRLLHRYRDGESSIAGHLDDYAFMVWGLIELYQASFDPEYLALALELNKIQLDDFWDFQGNGGFYFSSRLNKDLMVRQKIIYDGALPSGNSVALNNLLRLSQITGQTELSDYAAHMQSVFAQRIQQTPAAHVHFISSIFLSHKPTRELVVVGRKNSKITNRMLRIAQERYLPNTVLIFRPCTKKIPRIIDYVPYARNYECIGKKTTVYVCKGNRCQSPTTEIDKMVSLLNV